MDVNRMIPVYCNGTDKRPHSVTILTRIYGGDFLQSTAAMRDQEYGRLNIVCRKCLTNIAISAANQPTVATFVEAHQELVDANGLSTKMLHAILRRARKVTKAVTA